jgi:hypothetical protein
MMRENLFATPLWYVNMDTDDFNKNLLEESKHFVQGSNFFNILLPSTQKLKNTIIGLYDNICQEYKSLHPYPIIHGRLNFINYGQNDTPHNHIGKSILVGVYYLDVEETTGDILLHDPRGGTKWENLNFVPDDPVSEKSARTYHRIKPKNGLLIMFPSYVVHSVETNLSNKQRKSIVINI